MELLSRLSDAQLARVIERFTKRVRRKQLSNLQHKFVQECAVDGDAHRAAKAAGFRSPRPLAATAIELRDVVREREQNSALRGEYVRGYIVGVLEFCILDYLSVDDDGDWVVSPEEFKNIPRDQKRYIESVEIKLVRGEKRYKVNIVSKTAALALACKLTALTPMDAKKSPVALPWEQLARDNRFDDPIEAKILSVSETRVGR